MQQIDNVLRILFFARSPSIFKINSSISSAWPVSCLSPRCARCRACRPKGMRRIGKRSKQIKIKVHEIQGKCTRGVVDMHVAPTPRASIWACFEHRLLNLQTLLREAKVLWKCADPFLCKVLGETRKRDRRREGTDLHLLFAFCEHGWRITEYLRNYHWHVNSENEIKMQNTNHSFRQGHVQLLRK